MTFYIKRPGEHEGKPIGEPGEWDILGGLDAAKDEWSLYLPHQCDAWEIGYGTREQVLETARAFRSGLDEAIRLLEREQAQDGNEPARYAAARAGAARSLRAVEADAAEVGLGVVAGVAGWKAELLERPSPFSSVGIEPFDLVLPPPPPPWDGPWRRVPSSGCYEASFGWVHVRPACRCRR